eukprot:5681364-Pleurochrysis_carterae.AAC.1
MSVRSDPVPPPFTPPRGRWVGVSIWCATAGDDIACTALRKRTRDRDLCAQQVRNDEKSKPSCTWAHFGPRVPELYKKCVRIAQSKA